MLYRATLAQSVAEAALKPVEQLLGTATKAIIDECGAAPDLRMYQKNILLATVHGYIAECASPAFRCYTANHASVRLVLAR